MKNFPFTQIILQSPVGILLLAVILIPVTCFAQNMSDYLILSDIGKYAVSKPQVIFTGKPPVGGPTMNNDTGVLSGADHFPDHADKTYRLRYMGENESASPKVQITQHTGGDSDKWLLHELEDGYRLGKEMKAKYIVLNPIRIINDNKIWFQKGSYSWLSNNVVVHIEVTDPLGTKPEPIEVVQAYLKKFPSTMKLTNEEALKGAHNVQWIKDEMDRRLWLCDKWNARYKAGKATQPDYVYHLDHNKVIFLKFREKFFGGVDAKKEVKALRGYIIANGSSSGLEIKYFRMVINA